MSAHVLVVEDEPAIALGLREMLEGEGYRVTESRRGDGALRLLEAGGFDLVLLDLMLPGRGGLDVCRDMRARGDRTPVIMLTARGQEIDKVLGFRLGADDYVTKPFGVQELLERVAAVLRRTRGAPPGAAPGGSAGDEPLPREIRIGAGVVVRPGALDGMRGGEAFALTPREMALLAALWRRRGTVASRAELLAEVWGPGFDGTDRTVDQAVLRLRHKLEPDPAAPRHIRTVHGAGYRLDP